jgi:hypothetical protein
MKNAFLDAGGAHKSSIATAIHQDAAVFRLAGAQAADLSRS